MSGSLRLLSLRGHFFPGSQLLTTCPSPFSSFLTSSSASQKLARRESPASRPRPPVTFVRSCNSVPLLGARSVAMAVVSVVLSTQIVRSWLDPFVSNSRVLQSMGENPIAMFSANPCASFSVGWLYPPPTLPILPATRPPPPACILPTLKLVIGGSGPVSLVIVGCGE